MEKFKNFPEAIQALFGIDIKTIDETTATTTLSNSLSKNSKFETFLLATLFIKCEKIKLNNDFWLMIEKVTDCKIVNTKIFFKINRLLKSLTSQKTDEALIEEILQNRELLFGSYESIIILYTVLPNKIAKLCLSLFELHKEGLIIDRGDIIRQIIGFHSRFIDDSLIWRCFYFVCNTRSDNKISELKLIQSFVKKLIETDQVKMLLCFYWYYMYLGEKSICEIIFTNLFDTYQEKISFEMPFASNGFFWGGYTFDALRAKYDKIVRAMNGEELKDTLSDMLIENQLQSLIPLCLYAKEVGNIEVESFVLWYAMKKSKSPRLIQRMAEISGYRAPVEFLGTPLDQKPKWLTNRLHDCRKAFNGDCLPYSDSVKKVYSIRPFATEVLRALLKINTKSNDLEIERMLYYSINKLSAPIALGKILFDAIISKNLYGLKLILTRMIFLSCYDTILNSVDILRRSIKPFDVERLSLVREVLDFYKELVPKDEMNTQRFNFLDKKYMHLQNKTKNILGSLEKEELLEAKEALELLRQRNYKKLLQQFNNKTLLSLRFLEIVLKAALAEKNSKYVILAYNQLVEKNSVLASFYNSDIEPYLLERRISRETSKIGMGNLVSTVWGRPVVLENPVDKQTRIITWKEPKFRY